MPLSGARLAQSTDGQAVAAGSRRDAGEAPVMMKYVYTAAEGGSCYVGENRNTIAEIKSYIQGHPECLQGWFFVSGDDMLPPGFYSILLPDDTSWDAYSKTWHQREKGA